MSESDEVEFRRLLQCVGDKLSDLQTKGIAEIYGIPSRLYNNGADMLAILNGRGKIIPENVDKLREDLEINHAATEAVELVDAFISRRSTTATSGTRDNSSEVRISKQNSVTQSTTATTGRLPEEQPPEVDMLKWKDIGEETVGELPTIKWLLLVVNDFELRSLLTVFSGGARVQKILLRSEDLPLRDVDLKTAELYCWLFPEIETAVVCCEQGGHGARGAQEVLNETIPHVKPDYVVSVGVAWGIGEEQKIGDVLISYRVDAFDFEKISADGRVERRGNGYLSGDNLYGMFKNNQAGFNPKSKDGKEESISIYTGPILSGRVLLENKEVKAKLLEDYPMAIGGDMEGEGVRDACARYRNVDWISVKSICDWADGNKREEWQPYAATMAAQYVLHVIKKRREAITLIPRTREMEIFNKPATTTSFVKRSHIADTMLASIKPPSKNGATKYFALVGEGGAGKTQMSLWFCDEMLGSTRYDVIWFMSGDGLERFTEDLEDLMDELKIEYLGVNPRKLKRLLSKELNERGRWLLVVDNFEGMDLRKIEERIPEQGGSIVLTSRDHRVLPAKNIVEVKPFSDEEAMRLFENILGKGNVEESLVQEVGELLGHNAFTLSVCAYYLYESSIQADELAKDEIVKEMHELVTEMKHSVSGETVQAMYERSLLKLETESKAAWKLLCKLSLVSPDGVDKDIVGGFEVDHKTCLGKIQRLGLAEMRGDKYYVHRLMMKVVQERMNYTGEITSILEEVIGDMSRMWIEDDSDHTQWKKKQEMGEHVVSLAIHEEHLSSTLSREDLVWMLRDYSYYTIEVKGDYTTAEERITKAEQVEGGGKCSKGVRAALKSVRGDLNNRQGKYTEAITEYREALEMEEEESRKAYMYNNIGICLRKLHQYPEALEEYEKSLKIDMKYKGENSIEVSNTLDNMGGCLSSMGKYEEALEKHRRALKIRLDKYGEVNPLVAGSYTNIGKCYTLMKKYEEALEKYEKALEIFRQVYGEECHPDVATSLYNIGISLFILRKYTESRDHYLQLKSMQSKIQSVIIPDVEAISSFIFECNREIVVYALFQAFLSLYIW